MTGDSGYGASPRHARHPSLRKQLLLWILLPLTVLIALDNWIIYKRALEAIDIAYDRSLLASARSLGELLEIENGAVTISVPYVALENFDTGVSGRIFYRVSGFNGEYVSGVKDVAPPSSELAVSDQYPALVRFYFDEYAGETVRVAALAIPMAEDNIRGVAMVQVLETLDAREALISKTLRDTLIRQLVLLVLMGALTVWLISRLLRPLEEFRRQLDQRAPDDLSALQEVKNYREMQPLISALRAYIRRLAEAGVQQKRFIANAAHQLRTPLAVLKAQAQLHGRGQADASATVAEMLPTIDRAGRLTDQLLSLSRIDEVALRETDARSDLCEVAREAAVELSALMTQKHLNFSLECPPTLIVRGSQWLVGEAIRNLLHNAIRYTPEGLALGLDIHRSTVSGMIEMTVWDEGPGIDAEKAARLSEPFTTGSGKDSGSGLGLAIVHDIARVLNAQVRIEPRVKGAVAGPESRRGTAATIIFHAA
jgi:two-component system, OmpR family, sensor histidine kinase TctE